MSESTGTERGGGPPSTALVTGASSGIGLATVRALAEAGWSVIATARRPESADALNTLAINIPGIAVKQLDVTDDRSVDACIGSVLADAGRIDLLINNAGGGYRGTLEQLSLTELAAAMDLNFFGVARTTKAVLPAMRAARSGRIITVTSLNGVVAMPFSDAYNASKFAVEGLMEGLATVLREFGVHVSILEPGPVQTAFFTSTGGRRSGVEQSDPYAAMIDRFNARIASLAADGQAAESVADVICRIASDPSPALRYQSSDAAHAMVARKLVDPTGRSVLDATAALLRP